MLWSEWNEVVHQSMFDLLEKSQPDCIDCEVENKKERNEIIPRNNSLFELLFFFFAFVIL